MGSIGQKFIKQELERIWRKYPLAFPNHIAGWMTLDMCKKKNKGFWPVTNILAKVLGRKVRKWT